MVNFKSPPRAVFKSSAAARQACAPDTAVRNRRALSTPPSPLRRLWQAVVTCLPLSDKAASAHVAALSHCQRYEPTEALHSAEPKPVPAVSPPLLAVKADAKAPSPSPLSPRHNPNLRPNHRFGLEGWVRASPHPHPQPHAHLDPDPDPNPNHGSVQSLVSLLEDCTELEGLG